MSNSVRPHRRQPTRLPRPWDSPGKNTEVGCHFLLQCMKVKVKSLSRVQPLATPWTAAHQAPPFMGFSRQEYWSGVPLPSPISCLHDYKRLLTSLSTFSLVPQPSSIFPSRLLHSNQKNSYKNKSASHHHFKYLVFPQRNAIRRSSFSCNSHKALQ